MATNFIEVLVATISAMVIGGLWYSPLMFGKMWMELSGFTKEGMADKKHPAMWKLYLTQFIISFISAFVLSQFIGTEKIIAFGNLLTLVFSIWIGFQIPVFVSGVLWEGKSIKIFLLNSLQAFVSLLVMGIILLVIG